MTTPSTPVPQCNHRGLEVAVIILAALVVALITGITLALLRAPLIAVLGSAATAGYTASKAVLSFVKYMKQVN